MATTQFSMRIEGETKARLEAYSRVVKRSQSQIAAIALDEYLARHQAQILALQEGKQALSEGRVVSQGETEQWLRSWINGKPKNKPNTTV